MGIRQDIRCFSLLKPELSSFQCEVALSLESYDAKMEEHRDKNLEILQAELEKNKI